MATINNGGFGSKETEDDRSAPSYLQKKQVFFSYQPVVLIEPAGGPWSKPMRKLL